MTIDFLKNNWSRFFKYLCLFALTAYITLGVSREFLRYIAGTDNIVLVVIADIIMNGVVISFFCLFESKVRIKEKYEKLTKKIPEHRKGTISFIVIIISIIFLFAVFFNSISIINPFSFDIIYSFIFTYSILPIFYYIIYIVS